LDRFDWIQLKSGEWLKGEIKAMQDRELDFDSDEMDEQTFDWVDIRQLRSPRDLNVLDVEGEVVSGPVQITPTTVVVEGADAKSFPRVDLQSLTPVGKHERDYWSGQVSAGLTLRSGNTDQADYNASASLLRRTTITRLSLDYSGNYSSTDDTETANNHRVNSELNVWLSRRFYLVVPYAEYYRDTFQNLDHRVTGSVGAGYDLIYRPKLKWDVTLGPAYQYAWYVSAQPGEPTEVGAGAATFSTSVDWDITSDIELTLDFRGQYTRREIGETTHHAEATLSFDVTKHIDFDVSLIWDRIAQPKVAEDGTQPVPDDFRLIVSLAVDF
jgi:putative salt-induced outer membrane protein YdiY